MDELGSQSFTLIHAVYCQTTISSVFTLFCINMQSLYLN